MKFLTQPIDESGPDGRRDFDITPFTVVFPSTDPDLEVLVTDSFIFDDDIHEVAEVFVIIFEVIPQANMTDTVIFFEDRAALLFTIFDNDGIVYAYLCITH